MSGSTGWIILFSLLIQTVKCLSLQDKKHAITEEPKYSFKNANDWTSCPKKCTCLLGNMIYCSRQEFTGISSINSPSGTDFPNVIPAKTTTLHMGYNNITSLPNWIFWNGDASTEELGLKNLYLQHNKIAYIHPDAFASLPHLKRIDLSNNNVSRLFQDCVQMYPALQRHHTNRHRSCQLGNETANFLLSLSTNLRTLSLNFNSLKSIPDYSFRTLTNLEVLRLSWNNISSLSNYSFYGLKSLKILQIRSNSISKWSSTSSDMVAILRNLCNTAETRDRTDLGTLPKKSDTTAGNVSSIPTQEEQSDAEQWNYVEIDLGFTGQSDIPYAAFSTLERYYLDDNDISEISTTAFSKAHNLKLLNLAGNNIRYLASGTFSHLGKLLLLDLSRNNLTVLEESAFQGLYSLESLRLHNNKFLEILPKAIFRRLRSIRQIYLQNCNLHTLPEGRWIYKLVSIWLYGNPINCSCENLPLVTAIEGSSESNFILNVDPYRSAKFDDMDTWEYQEQKKTVCASPNHFIGCEISNFSTHDLGCTEAEVAQHQRYRIFHDKNLTQTTTARTTTEPLACPTGESRLNKADNSELEFSGYDVGIEENDDYATNISVESIVRNLASRYQEEYESEYELDPNDSSDYFEQQRSNLHDFEDILNFISTEENDDEYYDVSDSEQSENSLEAQNTSGKAHQN